MKTLALITSSTIRMAIVKSLNPTPHSWSDLKEMTEREIGRPVSPGSFNWHLEKLQGVRVISKSTNPGMYTLTQKGQKYSRTIIEAEVTLS